MMNKIRLLGLFLFISGLFINSHFENKNADFFSSAMMASGVIWIIIGKFRFGKKNE
jgi:hypothetical protein